MKKSTLIAQLAAAALVCGLSFSARAGTFIDKFTNTHDYVTAGIAGSSWDGVYLNLGDIPGGNNGGDGAGATSLASAAELVPGFGLLSVQTVNSSWAGAGDDGFFLYKNVAGDFDVTLEMPQPFDNQNYTFGGLMVRAAVSPTGAPFGGSENWLTINRLSEFGLSDGVRFASNGVDTEFLYTPGSDSDAATAERFFRITRIGDVFSLYDKTNSGDAWALESAITRGDLSGAPMQVGIKEATFTGNTPTITFADFELTGTNVNSAAPPSPATGLTVASAGSNAVTLSWTAGAGSTGSLVMVRVGQPVTHQPSFGVTYAGNTNLGLGAHLGGGNYVVLSATNTSVTVSGLGGSNIIYYAAVYSYNGSGSSINYSLDTPPATNFPGPGVLQAITLTVADNSALLGGVAIPTVYANYDSGTSNDVTAQAVLDSDTPGVITVIGGSLSALTTGSATISATYSGFNTNLLVTVRTNASFTDNFSVSHDYKSAGLPGSTWDGAYMQTGDVPNGDNGGDDAVTAGADANITSNNTLTVRTSGTTWAGTADDGFLLFKNAPGDFQASVHLGPFDITNFNFVGLMARASDPGGAPFGGSENWVYWSRFDEFTVTTEARTAINGGDNEFSMFNGLTNRWLLMVRSGGTNFLFFDKLNPGDPWTPRPDVTIVRPDLAGVPMQVGLFQATYTESPVEQVQFDTFTLDGPGVNTGTPPVTTASNLSVTLGLNNTLNVSWTPAPGAAGSVVVMRGGSPVSQQPLNGVTYTGNSAFGTGDNLGAGNYVIYTGTGSNVTVSNLTGGVTYYAAVYAYTGAGASIAYNSQFSPTSSALVGILQSLAVTAPTSIPAGGIGLPAAKVLGTYTGGSTNDLTAAAVFTSGNTNVVVVTNNLFTGVSNGSTTVTITFGGITNIQNVTVRNATFTDNFTSSHSYVTNGLTNTGWEGLYLNGGDVPGGFAFYGGDGPGVTSLADANITSNGVFTVQSTATDWEAAGEDGFFLFKNVVGDFQAVIHVGAFDVDTNVPQNNFNTPGLLARAYSTNGAPLNGANGESWISWSRFDDFGITTYARSTVTNITAQHGNHDASTDRWLLLARLNGTNFLFFQRTNPTDPWHQGAANILMPTFAGLPLQVGIQQATFGNTLVQQAQMDSFMLDTGTPTISIVQSGGNIILSWPAAYPGFSLQSSVKVGPLASWGASASSTLTNGNYVATVPITNTTTYFRLIH